MTALSFDVFVRDRQATRNLDRIGDAADKAEGRFSKLGRGMKTAGVGIAAAGAAAGAAALGMGKKLFDTAVSAEAMGNKTRIVFGESIGVVSRWADANAAKMGLTRRETQFLAANIGDLLTPMGFTQSKAAALSTQIGTLAGAFSQWSGGTLTATDASELLQDALVGEFDSLKQVGVQLDAATVDTLMAKAGKDKLTGSARKQAEAEIILKEITRQSSNAIKGYTGNTNKLGSAKNQLTARVKELRERVAVGLTPVFLTLANFTMTRVVPAFSRLSAWARGGLLPALQRLWGWVRGTAIPIIVRWAGPVLGAARKGLADVQAAVARNRPQLAALGRVLLQVGTWIARNVAPVMGRLAGHQLRSLIGSVAGAIRIVAGLVRGFQTLHRWGNNVAGAVRNAASAIRNLPSKIPGAGILGKLPGFQHGVRNFGGGWAVVGEAGPELVHLPRGADVMPMQGGGRPSGGVGGRTVIEIRSDGSRLADALVWVLQNAIRTRGGDVQVVLGG